MDGFTRGSAKDIGPQIELLLGEGQQVTLQISGDSMRPTLRPRRDAVVLEAFSAWPPRRGEILFYRSARAQSGYSLHRVLRVTDVGAVMNGDAQGWTETIEKGAVLGRAVALVRKGKLIGTEGRGQRAWAACWRITRPARKPLFALWRAAKKVVGKS